LCRQVFERPDLIDDPRFADNPRRSDNRRALDEEIEPWFAARTVEQAVAALDAADIAFARASRVEDLSTHPALRRRSVILPTGETVLVPRGAGKTGTAQVGKAGTAKAGGAEALPVSAPAPAPAPVPALGQATEAVREEFT
jgi:crotonobetainyl-CoA:carnitine CoA-transferase CaiB-like acyl-CoA transferase